MSHLKFHSAEEGFTIKNLDGEYPTIGELVMHMQTKQEIQLDVAMWPSDPAPDKLLPR